MSTTTTHTCDRCRLEITVEFGRRQATAVEMFAFEGVWALTGDLPTSDNPPIKRDLCHDCWQSIRSFVDTQPPQVSP